MWQPKRKNSSDDNMIPLINIVFLLLIFFMVAGQIQKRPDASINLPALHIDDTQAPAVQQMIEMFADGRIAINQIPVNQNGSQEIETGSSELADALSQLHGSVTLVADSAITAADLENILSELRNRPVGDEVSVNLLLEPNINE
ncbi:MAG: biopolymer transporter ExbD [Thalassolituus sp.]